LEIQVKKGDCFTFIKNVVYMDDVLKMIDKDFHLGISSGIYTGDKRLLVNINLKN
jgi:hypothetical protein